MPLDNHASDIQHSLYGRQFGLDARKLGVFGAQTPGFGGDIRYGTETIASTVPSTLAPAATTILAATATAAYELVPPSASMVGVRKRLIHNSTGAAQAQLVKLTAGNFLTNTGSSFTTLTMSTRGVVVDLEYLTTALVAAITQISSLTTGFYSYSTTT